MDMRFHWLQCRINQKHFRPYWRAGATNLADYVTKHHPAIHHQAVRPLYLTVNQPLLTHQKLTAPCITRRTVMRPQTADQLPVPHNKYGLHHTAARVCYVYNTYTYSNGYTAVHA